MEKERVILEFFLKICFIKIRFFIRFIFKDLLFSNSIDLLIKVNMWI